MDTTCAWCSEPWSIDGLRHDGWSYINSRQANSLNLLSQYSRATSGSYEMRVYVSRKVYEQVLRGKGCPAPNCGFGPRPPAEGPYRAKQLEQLVLDDVNDEDPYLFM
jgi:hypothetical protein